MGKPWYVNVMFMGLGLLTMVAGLVMGYRARSYMREHRDKEPTSNGVTTRNVVGPGGDEEA